MWREVFRICLTTQPVLRFFIFFVVLRIDNAIYVPLECEVCNYMNSVCTGPKQMCPVKKDTCAMTYSASSLDEVTTWITTEKGCESSNICGSTTIEIYLGKDNYYLEHVLCCTGDKCPDDIPELPKIPTEHKGKHCLSCFSYGPKCHGKMVDCKGNNIYCFQMQSRLYNERQEGGSLPDLTGESIP
ncbi:phospholipase A2 inhibitor and Ly6/PLAUR domain-containing protein-like [Anolis carolinensis]|uniref:phospholipase A2 inhibitor and Ly6/PLAUR domain-containing protein-like n=1 Tax=Anolis carolinensis TaxID=28377 RepID=UPI002F2B1B3A